MGEMTRRKCAFCPHNEPCAIMYIAEERNLAVHQNCLLFSSGFVESEEEDSEDPDKRFDVASVEREIKRGKRLACYVCRKKGATIGCEVKNCRKSYHYFCALRGNASTESDEDQGFYRLFCPGHTQAERSCFYDENNEKAMPLVPTKSSSTTTQMVNSIMGVMTRRKCAFCPDNVPCAIMYVNEERNLAVHQNCLLFSSGFVELEKQNPADLDKPFDMASVVREIKRGKQLLCNVCLKRGATIDCEVKDCHKSYHYFCALRSDASIETDEDQGLYRLFCPDHTQAKTSCSYDENNEKAMPLVPTESPSTTTQMLFVESEEEDSEDLDKRFDVAPVERKIKREKRPIFVESEEEDSEDLDKRFDVAPVEPEIKRRKRLIFVESEEEDSEDLDKRFDVAPVERKIKREKRPIFVESEEEDSEDLDKRFDVAPVEPEIKRRKRLNGETVGEENMEVISEKCDQPKERIEFLKKCKQTGLLNEIFEKMLNTLRLAQEKLMDDNTSEAEYEKTVISLFDCGLFEVILRTARSGTEGKIQELMNTRQGLDTQIGLLRDLKEIVFPVSEDNASSSMS